MSAACGRPQPPARGESPGMPGGHPTRRQQAHTPPTRPRPGKTTRLPSTRDPQAPHRTIPIRQIVPSAPIPVPTQQIELLRVSAGQVWPNLRRWWLPVSGHQVQGGGRAGPLQHDLNGPLVGAADDGQLQGAAKGRPQCVEEVIHAADRAVSGRDDQVARREVRASARSCPWSSSARFPTWPPPANARKRRPKRNSTGSAFRETSSSARRSVWSRTC
jgi:hypothetical protein